MMENKANQLLDTLGRRNRKLSDRACETCGNTFRPLRKSSRFCSRPCMWAKNGGHNKKAESWWVNQKGYVEGRIWLPNGTQICVKQDAILSEAQGAS